MKAGGAHLSYCTNIHPGESWPETRAVVDREVTAVKAALGLEQPMGVGLRLSAAAAEELSRPGRLESFCRLLARRGLYVFTLNGFPFGAFHGGRVKDQVYLPDWRDPARLAYSNRLAKILAELLPEGADGSISTVPGGYKAHLGPEAQEEMAANLIAHAALLHQIHRRMGRMIALALEPEPDCLLETTPESVSFFQERLFSAPALALAARLTGLGRGEAEAMLRRHLGICLDACHAAVAFETPRQAVDGLRAAGIAIAKVQLSAGLRVPHPGPAERAALRPFAEDVYLHQVAALADGGLRRHADLDEALADPRKAEEWRIHFHVPLWAEHLDGFASTADWVAELLALHRAEPVSAHLEVETYTWSVLAERHRPVTLTNAIAGELQWVLDRLQ